MMNVKVNKIFIATCLVLLCLPLVFLGLRLKIDDPYSSKKINGNFERNFPLKADLFRVYAYIKSTIFNVNSIPDKVIQLDNGWLFCSDHYSNALSESLGLLHFSNTETQTLQNKLTERNNWYTNHNIQYYLAIAPNKESVYSHLLPLKKTTRKTKQQQVDSICLRHKIRYIDLGKTFPDPINNELYYKTDTHWNEVGGFYGYLSMLQEIQKNNPTWDLPPMKLNDFKKTSTNQYVGDILDMLQLPKTEKNITLEYVIKPTAIKIASKLPIPDEYPSNPLTYESRYTSPKNKLKILLFGDSFSPYISKFLKEHFGETVVIWNQTFSPDLILSEKPDVVIQEIVARNIDLLLE